MATLLPINILFGATVSMPTPPYINARPKTFSPPIFNNLALCCGNIGKQASPSHIFHHIRLGEYTTKKFFIDILFFYYLELFSSLNTKLIIPLARIVLLKILTYSPYPVITLVNRAPIFVTIFHSQ